MHRPVVFALSALLLFGLTGCATEERPAAPAAAGETVEAAAAGVRELDGEILDGVGTGASEEKAFSIPEAARSAVIRFACAADGYFQLEVFDPAADLAETSGISGVCDGVHDLVIPIHPSTPGVLTVAAPDGTVWVAQTSFSTAEPTNDADLAAECDALSVITSAFTNADQGLGWAEAFGEDEWQARVGAAREELGDFAAESTTVLGPVAAVIAAEAVPAEPGEAYEAVQPSYRLASALCKDNRSEMYVIAEFGG